MPGNDNLHMSYSPITINRSNLTIMGVVFPNLEILESTAEAIGSNMFEGFKPTKKGIEIIRDYCLGLISLEQLMSVARAKSYEE